MIPRQVIANVMTCLGIISLSLVYWDVYSSWDVIETLKFKFYWLQ